MTSLDQIALPLAIRICLVVLFPFSALDKIFNWDGALKQANSSFIPGGPVLLVLACYCAATALLYHNFWAYPDFWHKGESVARTHFWDFLKNFGLVGGMLLITFGMQLAPLHKVAAHPLSSTPVYAPAPSPAESAP